MLPTAAAGLADWLRDWSLPAKIRPALVAALAALLWADPTWAYDASWFTKPYQLHWPALRSAGDWVKAHPEAVPPDARIMTWFPWEFRLASGRTTVLMPRNYSLARLRSVAEQYGVTHVLWGSFETPPHVDPETFGPYLTELRTAAGLADSKELYRSPREQQFGVRLYRLKGAAPMTDLKPAGPTPRWAIAGLILILAFNVWWRWHTIGPTPARSPVRRRASSGRARPSRSTATRRPMPTWAGGCSAATSSIATSPRTSRRSATGSTRLAVAIGGANEPTIRLDADPLHPGDDRHGLVARAPARRARRRPASRRLVFAVADTDPYVFGNGSNLEHFLNFFSVASLAPDPARGPTPDRRSPTGVLLGGGLRGPGGVGEAGRGRRMAWSTRSSSPLPVGFAGAGRSLRLVDVAILGRGIRSSPWCWSRSAVLLAQGAGRVGL